MTDDTNNPRTYRTLEDIRLRKQELRRQLDNRGEHISQLWSQVYTKREETTRGQFISNVISNSALAIDAFLMIRKLRRDYKSVASLFKRSKKRR
ncbi:MAG: hypothetical protein IJ243_11755 [Prevotella sp.]|nr:hypothetical protein [Prevotella sp.]